MEKQTKEISNNEKKKTGYFRTMFRALKDAKNHYKENLTKEAEKRRLLNSKSDWTMIEELVQQVNNNPSLRIRVMLNDGTNIYINTYEEEKIKDYQLLD